MNKGSAFWMGHVEAIRREGISTNAYANRHGIAVKRLYYWQRKTASVAAASSGAELSGAFVALRVAPLAKAVASANCTLVLVSGVRLEMAALPTPEWLAALGHASQEVY
jgi:hypothetical protein